MTKSKKALFGMLSMFLVAAVAVAGVVMWLTDETDTIENTFTVGNIDIELAETTGDQYKMVPGDTIDKDPKVTVLAGSEASYVFVKIEKSDNFDDFLTYGIADGWTPLTGVEGVYYREVAASDVNQEFSVLANNQVTVKDEVTKDMMDAIKSGAATQPTLSFTAYAVQKDNVADAVTAWGYVTAA